MSVVRGDVELGAFLASFWYQFLLLLLVISCVGWLFWPGLALLGPAVFPLYQAGMAVLFLYQTQRTLAARL